DALRSHWLPDQRIVATLGARPMERLDLLMEETDPPHRQSIVSFSLSDRPYGGTTLAIRHSVKLAAAAANSNSPTMLLRAA
ncbi:hypothetical protein DUP91_27120, partial [Salmonella enterica subsp. enterica]|nr:hypothetical protein [Salmonella enterica subsp. enterica]